MSTQEQQGRRQDAGDVRNDANRRSQILPEQPSPASTAPEVRRQLRGRSREWQAALELLGSLAVGQSAVMQVEGAAGIGKTRLLAEVEDGGADLGFGLATGHAGDLPEAFPLAQLSAGPEAARPGQTRPSARPTGSEREAGLRDVAAEVGELAGRRPIVVTLDDLQWADEAAVHALRALLALLSDHPVGWVLARRAGVPSPATDLLFDEWRQRGAVRIALGPLASDAVAEVVADSLLATPEPDLLSLTDGAAGNPQLLVALLDGLREERAVVVADGRARLVSRRIPRRVDGVIRDWMGPLSPEARSLLEVAALMERAFDVDDLARVYGRPTAQLLAPIREILESGLLTRAGRGARAFHHGLVRQAVADGVPAAVRWALSSQAPMGTRLDSQPSLGTGFRPSERGGPVPPNHDGPEATAMRGERGDVERRPSPVGQARSAWAALTETEQAVAELVSRGLTNREVAVRVFLSRHTVSFHLRKVYRKLGVSSRVELARFSIELERHPALPQTLRRHPREGGDR
jgi:DNA-binding CsgD family transcriptional regulator